jgi:hypothetical protein
MKAYDLRLTCSWSDCGASIRIGISLRNLENEMSVLLTISSAGEDGEPSSSTPLATEEFFERLWMRGALQINAKWIPLFQSGIDLEVDDLPSVCEELRSLGRWAEGGHLGPGDQLLMTSRIDAALGKLGAASGMDPKCVRIFIG